MWQMPSPQTQRCAYVHHNRTNPSSVAHSPAMIATSAAKTRLGDRGRLRRHPSSPSNGRQSSFAIGVLCANQRLSRTNSMWIITPPSTGGASAHLPTVERYLPRRPTTLSHCYPYVVTVVYRLSHVISHHSLEFPHDSWHRMRLLRTHSCTFA